MPAEFDAIAEVYDNSMAEHINAHYAHKRAAFVQSLGGKGPVLDVGCGTGTLARALRETGYNVRGLDLSTGMLSIMLTQHKIPGVCGNSFQLPFPDNAFGVVICVAVLHHVVDPEPVANTIREMVRVTRPGGHTVVWDHNPLNPYWPWLMARLPQDAGRTRLVPAEEIFAALPASVRSKAQLYRLGWTPEFVPKGVMGPWVALEGLLEHTPLVKELSAHNVVVVRK